MFAAVLALAMSMPSCPVTAGIARNGDLFSDRFHGWYKISEKTLKSDLRGGCYNDANSLPVTSIELFIAPNAPKAVLDRVFSILQKEGCSRSRISVKVWKNDPELAR